LRKSDSAAAAAAVLALMSASHAAQAFPVGTSFVFQNMLLTVFCNWTP